MDITTKATDDDIWAFAQFVKRTNWHQFRKNAIDQDEAYQIREDIVVLKQALAETGYAPR